MVTEVDDGRHVASDKGLSRDYGAPGCADHLTEVRSSISAPKVRLTR